MLNGFFVLLPESLSTFLFCFLFCCLSRVFPILSALYTKNYSLSIAKTPKSKIIFNIFSNPPPYTDSKSARTS